MILATISHLLLGRSISETCSVFSICVTVVVLNVHFRSPQTHKMAPWVKRVSWGHMNCTSILVELVIIAFINTNSKVKKYRFCQECFFCDYIYLSKLFQGKHSTYNHIYDEETVTKYHKACMCSTVVCFKQSSTIIVWCRITLIVK